MVSILKCVCSTTHLYSTFSQFCSLVYTHAPASLQLCLSRSGQAWSLACVLISSHEVAGGQGTCSTCYKTKWRTQLNTVSSELLPRMIITTLKQSGNYKAYIPLALTWNFAQSPFGSYIILRLNNYYFPKQYKRKMFTFWIWQCVVD